MARMTTEPSNDTPRYGSFTAAEPDITVTVANGPYDVSNFITKDTDGLHVSFSSPNDAQDAVIALIGVRFGHAGDDRTVMFSQHQTVAEHTVETAVRNDGVMDNGRISAPEVYDIRGIPAKYPDMRWYLACLSYTTGPIHIRVIAPIQRGHGAIS